jgi:hypothetical protein
MNRIALLNDQQRNELEAMILEIQHSDDATSSHWKNSTEDIFRKHGFQVLRSFTVPSRGNDNYRGKVGLLCARQDMTVAMEFGNQMVKQKSIAKLSQLDPATIRLVGIRSGYCNGDVEGVDRVFSRLPLADDIAVS